MFVDSFANVGKRALGCRWSSMRETFVLEQSRIPSLRAAALQSLPSQTAHETCTHSSMLSSSPLQNYL